MTRRLLPIFLVLAACSSTADRTTTTAVITTPGPTTTTVVATTSGPTATTITTTLAPPPPLEDIRIAITLVADGFEQPIFVTARPGDDRLYIVDQVGTVWALLDGTRGLILDITELVAFGGEQGLLGLAFHPTNPERMFVHYSDEDGDTVVAEYAFPIGAAEADPGAVQAILELRQPASNHNGGMIAFGPDGHLYIALGDGGGGGDPFDNGQNPFTLLGALLRLDVDTSAPYAIPPDNPFADGIDGAPEVWAFGVRNPWRFSFDGADLWIGDVGQNEWEEIHRIGIDDGGANLGWNVLEGTHCFAGTPEQCADPSFTPPVFEYPHDERCSVTGGYVYRGSEIPGLVGTYLYSDYCTGGVMALRVDAADRMTETANLLETGQGVTSFGMGLDGEMYLTQGDSVYRIVPAP